MSHADDLARRSSLLRFVPEAQQAAVLALFDRVEYAFGDEIVAEGDPADAWYIVVSGRARVLRRQPDGEEIMLGRLLPGDEFGEAALHAGGVRNATVRASTTLSALRLARARFAELLRQQPALQQALELQSRWR
ncbi:MAG: cyclic nucleotide-binding domain-containing protein, partial [Rhodanobacteraceae bacterium]|nr:cyclic nucleotide-binding domain-containing protein [Rhodanobacteraceae bacterium]